MALGKNQKSKTGKFVTKLVKKSNDQRNKICAQLAANMKVAAASAALDPSEKKELESKFSPRYMHNLMGVVLWLGFPGLKTIDSLQNVDWHAMFTTYTYIWQNCNSVLPYTGRMRGNPASGVPDSKMFDPTFVLDDKFDPECAFPNKGDSTTKLVSAADKLRLAIFEDKAPSNRVHLYPEHATELQMAVVRPRMEAFFIAFAAAYMFGDASGNKKSLSFVVENTFNACMGDLLTNPDAVFEMYQTEAAQQAGTSTIKLDLAGQFVADTRFAMNLKTEANLLATGVDTKQQMVDMSALLADPEYALYVFLAALPLVRVGLYLPLSDNNLCANFCLLSMFCESLISSRLEITLTKNRLKLQRRDFQPAGNHALVKSSFV